MLALSITAVHAGALSGVLRASAGRGVLLITHDPVLAASCGRAVRVGGAAP